MVDDDSIKPLPFIDCKVVSFFTKAEICEVTRQDLYLTGILLAQIFERSLASSYNHKPGLLPEQEVGDSKTDA